MQTGSNIIFLAIVTLAFLQVSYADVGGFCFQSSLENDGPLAYTVKLELENATKYADVFSYNVSLSSESLNQGVKITISIANCTWIDSSRQPAKGVDVGNVFLQMKSNNDVIFASWPVGYGLAGWSNDYCNNVKMDMNRLSSTNGRVRRCSSFIYPCALSLDKSC